MIYRLKRVLVWMAAATGFLMAAVTFLPVLEPWIHWLAGTIAEPRGDILIVLGNDVNVDGTIGLPSYWRAIYAVRAWREGGFKEMVISGGGGVSEAMREFIVAEGVPGAAVHVEGLSGTTHENATFVADMLRQTAGRKVLLTSDFHMFRALRAFRKSGLETSPRPLPDAAKRAGSRRERWPLFFDLVTETAKIAGYRLRGWI